MKPKLFLRIAAALMFLHTIGHTIGALTWKQAPNAAIGHVIREMEVNHFIFMGRQVTLASFFEGYGIGMIGVLLLISIQLWFLSGDSERPLSARYAASFTVFLLFFGIMEYFCFFPFAAVISLLAGLCSGVALIGLNKLKNENSVQKNK